MSLVCYNASMTMHIGDAKNNEYLKIGFEIKDIDTAIDFDKQMQEAHVTFHKLAKWGNDQLGDMMLKALEKQSL